jgi:uncharacterized protein YcgI (DUF1989 family)
MSDQDLITIPAGHGKAARLDGGQKIKLINTHGSQVVDCWAFNAYDLAEYMSMESSRVWNLRLNPKLVVEDTTPGIHDTFCAACDRYRYAVLGVEGYHRNCQDNMFEGMAELGVTPPFPIAASWNIFMNIPVLEDRVSIDVRPTECTPGDYIVIRAEMDCYVAFSACPQDILPIHGEGGAPPRDCQFQVLD